MVANPARCQLNRENVFFSWQLCPFAPENLASRHRFGRPVPRQPARSPHSSRINPESDACSHGIPPCTVNRLGSTPSQSVNAVAYHRRSLPPIVRRHRVSSRQGSSSNGCCLFRFDRGPIFYAPLFSHTHNGTGMCSVCLKKNLNVSRPSEHRQGEKCQNV